MWKTKTAARMREYNCDLCRRDGKIKNRVCFRYGNKLSSDGTTLVKIRRIGANGRPLMDDYTHRQVEEERQLDEEGVMDEIGRFQDALPDMSAYQVASSFFKGICMQSFVDEISHRLIEAETEVSQYGVNINDESIRQQLLGFDMSLPDLLEAFAYIRGTKHAYEKWEFEEMAEQGK